MEPQKQWTEARLLQLIHDQVEESSVLEYKGAGALGQDKKQKHDITLDVSAFANASGGTVIYGIAEYKDDARKHRPERIDPIDRTQFSKEWLEQIIGQIQPRIASVHVEPVPLSSGENDVAYVVEVPEAETAHQALTLKYHRRYNFEALAMTDREIRDVMNRRKHPKFKVSAKLLIYAQPKRDGQVGKLEFTLNNVSDSLARHVLLIVHAPVKIKGQPILYPGDGIPFEEIGDGGAFKLVYTNHLGSPLFPRTTFTVEFEFEVSPGLKVRATKPFSELYHYSVFADTMPVLRGSFKFDEIYEPPKDGPWVEVK